MSLLNDVRKSITDAADTIVEKGQQLSELARLQIAMKKLQVDRAKRLHELGTRAYALYQVEKLLAKNPLPREIHEMCEPIEEIDKQMEDTQRQMEEVHAAAQDAAGGATHTVEAVATNGQAEAATPPVAETFVQTAVPVAPATSAADAQAADLLRRMEGRIETLERQLSEAKSAAPEALIVIDNSPPAHEDEPSVGQSAEEHNA